MIEILYFDHLFFMFFEEFIVFKVDSTVAKMLLLLRLMQAELWRIF